MSLYTIRRSVPGPKPVTFLRKFSPEFLEPLHVLDELGFKCSLAFGGAVRDDICKITPRDRDIMTAIKRGLPGHDSPAAAIGLIRNDPRFGAMPETTLGTMLAGYDEYGPKFEKTARLRCIFKSKSGAEITLDITILEKPISPEDLSLNADAPINSGVVDTKGRLIGDAELIKHCDARLYELRSRKVRDVWHGLTRFRRIRDRAYPDLRFTAPANFASNAIAKIACNTVV